MAPSSLLLSGPSSSSLHPTSPLGLASVLSFSLVIYGVYFIVSAVYLIFFHPLRHIPGPKLWIAFPILRHISAIRGQLDHDVRSFFKKYNSSAIRVNPKEVYFNTGAAWQDIYGHGHTPQLPKPMRSPPGETHNIVNANDIDHTRFRRTLAHAFSDRALREQESLLQGYTSSLISRLSEFATSNKPVNVVKYYNFTTFDIIGDLSFGQPFGCLSSNSYHWWISNVLKMLQQGPFIRAAYEYPFLMKLLCPKSLPEARAKAWALARERVNTRQNNESQKGRADFIDFLERHKGESNEITDEEIISHMFILIIAGSETTATLLSGVTYWLLRTPHALKRATEEIRSTFLSEEDITIPAVTTRLPYTIACLEEALRLYPPAPSVLPRMTLEQQTIAGYVIPKGTHVAVHHSATYWSESNFHRATEYVPERWLKENTEDPSGKFYHDGMLIPICLFNLEPSD